MDAARDVHGRVVGVNRGMLSLLRPPAPGLARRWCGQCHGGSVVLRSGKTSGWEDEGPLRTRLAKEGVDLREVND